MPQSKRLSFPAAYFSFDRINNHANTKYDKDGEAHGTVKPHNHPDKRKYSQRAFSYRQSQEFTNETHGNGKQHNELIYEIVIKQHH